MNKERITKTKTYKESQRQTMRDYETKRDIKREKRETTRDKER